MKWNEEAVKRIEAYLDEVEKGLAHKPSGVRADVVGGLRDQIHSSLRQIAEAGGAVDLEAVERVLAEMDAPETFAEGEESAPVIQRAGLGRWFWLGVAFLLVNIYGVWKWTVQPAIPVTPDPQGTEEVVQPVRPIEKILRLRKVEQVDVSAGREVMLLLSFSETPDRKQLTRFLKFTAENQEVKYHLMGTRGKRTVMIETEPVLAEKLTYLLREGLPAMVEGVQPDNRGRNGALAMEMNMLLKKVEANSSAFEPGELRVDFTAYPDVNGVEAFISVKPEVEYTVEGVNSYRGKGLALRGDFEPGHIYEVTFKAGLPAENGSSLPKTLMRRIQFPLPRSAVRLDVPGRYLSPDGTLQLPIKAVNLSEVVSRMSPVFANNLVMLAQRESDYYRYYGQQLQNMAGETIVVTNILPASRESSTVKTTLDLRAMTDGTSRGVFWLELTGKKASGEGRLLVITDLGIAARTYEGGALVWVNSLRTAEPTAGAAVSVYARNNQVLARGTADERGLVQLNWKQEGDFAPFIITAELDGDLSYMSLNQSGVSQGSGLGGAATLDPGELEAAVFSDRGIYRPGESVFIQALVRDAQLQSPAPFPALMRIRRPDGRVFQDVPVELDVQGSAETTAVLPDYLPTGRYALSLVMPGTFTSLGSTSIALEDFVPPQIRVEVEPTTNRIAAGDLAMFDVRSEHLFGRPASGLKVKAGVTFNAAPFSPSNWPGWHFGDKEKSFSQVVRQLGAKRLDAEGTASFEVESRSAWRPPARLRMIQQATVLETSGRAVAGYAACFVDAYPFYVGMKPSWEGAVRAGEPQHVSLMEVMPNGSPVTDGKPLVLSLWKVSWNSVLRRNRSGRYEWKSSQQKVKIRKDTLAVGGASCDWPFVVEVAGEYLLVASDPASGASSSLSFHAGSANSQWNAWSREKPGWVELAWDRETYRAGETARLQVRAPFTGDALLTVETDRVLTSRVVTLEKNTAEFEVPVQAAYAPNAYCTLTLIRPAEAEAVWSAHRAIGVIVLPVERPSHRLAVELNAPPVTRPQAPLTSTVTVRDAQGNPVSGSVTLMAVDEAICMLTDYQTPDPLKVLNRQRALGVGAYDLYSELMPVTEDQVEGVPRSGGGAAGELRRRLNPIKADRFKPVALWKSDVALDTNGQAAIELDLPEFSGELRLMAVAYNATQIGSGDSAVLVKRDLIVQPSLPRFLAIGDTCEAAVMLYNESGAPLTAVVRVTCGGPLRAEVAEQAIELPEGGSERVVIPLVAGPGPGKARCQIEVEAGSESYREAIEIAVRPASATRVMALSRRVAAGESATIEPPAAWLKESLYLSGAVSPSPSLQLGRALDYVVHYPYGCLEQTVSGSFPLLQIGDWTQELLPSNQAIGDVDAWVPAAISRVLSMQRPLGNFALWPSSNAADDEASLYALHFLLEAKAAGFMVPAEPLETALDWARGWLDTAISPNASEEDWILEMQSKAYLCHLLALAGRPDPGWNARLREQSARLNYAARAQTAAALLLAGEPRQAIPLMESVNLPISRPRVPGRLLHSEVRDAALMLSTWLDVDPENEAVDRLAQYLRDSQQDGHWGNTQDNAMALLAFGKLARLLPAEEESYEGTLLLPDGTRLPFSDSEPVEWDLDPETAGAVTVKNEGPGDLYLWSRIEGVSTEPEPDVEQGVSIHREFLDIEGQPLDPSVLPQGELIVIRLTVGTKGLVLDQLVIEDLLPAGWEIENPNLATSRQLPWLKKTKGQARHREARDDRMLIFTGGIQQKAVFLYAARAVTPGIYTLPPVTVSGMYEPEIRGASGGGQVTVIP